MRNDVAVHLAAVTSESRAVPASVRIVTENGSVIESPSQEEAHSTPTTKETGGADKPRAEYTWYFALDSDIEDISGIETIIQKDVITSCTSLF
jgi:hypothetical protein